MGDPRHERVANLLREHGPLAPPRLRAQVEAELEHARTRRGRRPAPGARRILAAFGATAVILVALALPLLGGDGTHRALALHDLYLEGPAAGKPGPRPGRPELLTSRIDGVDFPRWGPELGWQAYGERRDEVDGRETHTVFYEHFGHTLAYTIVSGTSLGLPEDAERVRVNGVELAFSRDEHGHEIAVFERGGRTCILSGHVKERSTVIELATWAGDGRVEF